MLIAYSAHVKAKELERYRFELVMWKIGAAISGAGEPPRIPPILTESGDDGES